MAQSSSASIQITVDESDVERLLRNVGDALDTVGIYAFLHSSVGPWLRERAENRFANEGDDVVGNWEPLSPATNLMRADQGFPPEHPINHRTGELERYITRSGWDIMTSPTLSVLKFPGGPPPGGELANKVRTAQAGSFNPATVPRPVLGLNEADLAFTLAAMATFISIASRAP